MSKAPLAFPADADFQIGQQSADQLPWFHDVAVVNKLSVPVLRVNQQALESGNSAMKTLKPTVRKRYDGYVEGIVSTRSTQLSRSHFIELLQKHQMPEVLGPRMPRLLNWAAVGCPIAPVPHRHRDHHDLGPGSRRHVRQAQHKAALSANAEMLRMYWDVGRMIAARQMREGWGKGVLGRLAGDLRNEIPEVKGFSERNLQLMIQFHDEYPSLFSIPQRPVAELPQADMPSETGPRTVPQLSAAAVANLNDPPDSSIAQRAVAQLSWAHILAEYALRDTHKPIGIADYELTRALPKALASSLPGIEGIEADLSRDLETEKNESDSDASAGGDA